MPQTVVEEDLPQQNEEDPVDPEETNPPPNSLESRLAAARQWAQEAKDMRELDMLEGLRLRVESGDVLALDSLSTDADGAMRLKEAPSSSRTYLPRPEAPHRFTRKDRRDYNMWVRDCEQFHIRNPAEFSTEILKTDFGLHYTDEVCKSTWATYCNQYTYTNPMWTPTWELLKQRMLDMLGTPAERRQAAYNSIKECTQKRKQTPTDTLNYLRPLWEEVEERNPDRQLNDYVATLLPEIQKDLSLLALAERSTISQVEEQANTIYRRLPEAKMSQNTSSRGSLKHRREDSGSLPLKKSHKSDRGSRSTSRGRGGKFNAPKPSTAEDGEVRCYECGEAGHIKLNCPKLSDKPFSSRGDYKSGKGRGRKD